MRITQHKQFKLRTFAPNLKSGKFEIGNIEYQFSSAFSAKTLALWISKRIPSMAVEGCWDQEHESFFDQPKTLKF